MQKRRLILVIVLIVIIAVSAFAVLYTSPSWLPRSTALSISPSSYTIVSGSALALSASVKYGSASVSGGTITWQTTGGSLSATTGPTVVFTAPSVSSNQSFTITASFGGTGVYQASSSTSHVTVSPPKAAPSQVTVSPPTFQVYGGDSQSLTASVQSNGKPVNGSITWSIAPTGFGSLSSNTAPTVTYTAPTVQQSTPVTITATFAGTAQYASSSGSSSGSVLPSQAAKKISTTLVISPSSFAVASGETQNLSAIVEVNGTALVGATINWSLTPSGFGSLSAVEGNSAAYTAPSVKQNTTVTVTASYSGDATHLGTSGSSQGTVTPPSMLQYQYVMTVSSALLTRVTMQGPIILNGTDVTLVSAESANLSGFSLTRFGLTAPTMYVDDLVLYATYINGVSPAFGGSLAIKGSQTINVGPKDSATLANATIGVLRMEGDSANLTDMQSVGTYVGGSEPYIPCIITAPSVSMSNTYSITGPTTWQSETNMVSNITTGRIDLPQFQLVHPFSYSLNRHSKTYNATDVWSLSASSATALKVSAFIVYFKVTGGEMVTLIATGSDNPNNLIPFGLNTGGGFNGLDINVQPVFFGAAQLGLGSFVISITPPPVSSSGMIPATGPAGLSSGLGVVPMLSGESRPGGRANLCG